MKKLILILFALILGLLLLGCEEEKTIVVEIDGHYTKAVLVDGKRVTEYYIVVELENEDDFMVRVYPETGLMTPTFKNQFPIGMIIEIKEKDKIPIPEVVK